MPTLGQAWIIVGMSLCLGALHSPGVRQMFCDAEKELQPRLPYWFRMLCGVAAVGIVAIAWPMPLIILLLQKLLGRGK